MKKTSFTFAELVLVIGCAAVIGSLTIAAAGGKTVQRKIIACAANIRILELKLTAWENANDGRLISFLNCGRPWGGQLWDAGYFNDTGFYGNNLKVYPKHFNCPAETRQRNNGKVNISKPSVNVRQSYDYGLNYFVHKRIKKAGEKLIKRSELRNPSKVMRLTDSVFFWVSNDPKNGTDRHGKGSGNVLFGDGHVEFVKTIPFKGRPGYNHKFWFN